MPPPILFDRNRIATRLKRRGTGPDGFFADLVLNDLRERLATITRKFTDALILAPSADFLIDKAETADGDIHFEQATTLLSDGGLTHLDSENLAIEPATHDLIVSILDLQSVNDVPGFLRQARLCLKPDGLFLAAAIGGQSLQELRSAWLSSESEVSGVAYARIAPFIDIRDAGRLLQHAGFALPVADIESMVIRYDHPVALMHELRKQGATNPMRELPARATTRKLLGEVIDTYRQNFQEEDGRVRATLEIVWLCAWSPHESQQKPLAPGSAKRSLKTALEKKSVS